MSIQYIGTSTFDALCESPFYPVDAAAFPSPNGLRYPACLRPLAFDRRCFCCASCFNLIWPGVSGVCPTLNGLNLYSTGSTDAINGTTLTYRNMYWGITDLSSCGPGETISINPSTGSTPGTLDLVTGGNAWGTIREWIIAYSAANNKRNICYMVFFDTAQAGTLQANVGRYTDTGEAYLTLFLQFVWSNGFDAIHNVVNAIYSCERLTCDGGTFTLMPDPAPTIGTMSGGGGLPADICSAIIGGLPSSIDVVGVECNPSSSSSGG